MREFKGLVQIELCVLQTALDSRLGVKRNICPAQCPVNLRRTTMGVEEERKKEKKKENTVCMSSLYSICLLVLLF